MRWEKQCAYSDIEVDTKIYDHDRRHRKGQFLDDKKKVSTESEMFIGLWFLEWNIRQMRKGQRALVPKYGKRINIASMPGICCVREGKCK